MPYKSITQYVAQIKALEDSGFDLAATIMTHIGIDMMSRLTLPEGETRQSRRHFKAWVDEFMKAHPDQPYQYDGDDVYAARCAILHNYTSEADIHEREQNTKKFGYHDGGKHMLNKDVDARLVLIGMKSFNDDFIRAIGAFVEKIRTDDNLRHRVESRLNSVFQYMPIGD